MCIESVLQNPDAWEKTCLDVLSDFFDKTAAKNNKKTFIFTILKNVVQFGKILRDDNINNIEHFDSNLIFWIIFHQSDKALTK